MKTWEEWRKERYGSVYEKNVRDDGGIAIAIWLWVPKVGQHLRYVQIFSGQIQMAYCWRQMVATEIRRIRNDLRWQRDCYLQEHGL